MIGPKRGGGGVVLAVAALTRSSVESLRRSASLRGAEGGLGERDVALLAALAGLVAEAAAVEGAAALADGLWREASGLRRGHGVLTEKEPADSPKMVTLVGSPPKAAMLRLTHWRAAVWSMRP